MDQNNFQLSVKHPIIKALFDQYDFDRAQLAKEEVQTNESKASSSVDIIQEKIDGLRSKFIQDVNSEMAREGSSSKFNCKSKPIQPSFKQRKPKWMSITVF